MSYLQKMIGWFIEIYQGKQFFSTSIFIVFPNDISEIETGKILKNVIIVSALT